MEISSQAQLRDWLLKYHTQEESVWLVTYKKGTEGNYVSTGEVLDELLCFGWIDGIRRKLDDEKTMQLISPRKTQHWAKTYKDRVATLTKEDRMHEAGLQSIEVSKRNGLWNFMDDVDQLIKPNDLAEALSKKPDAEAFFDQINDSSKRFVLRWLKLAKTDRTRTNRIEKLVELSAKGEKLPGS
ncbi:MAG: YdeI/OmpD-associated family protein [Bacteroidota bacterium]